MYIRIEIYDGVIKEKDFKVGKILEKYNGYITYYEKENYNEETDEVKYKYVRLGKGLVGYYDDKNYEIAKAFSENNEELVDKKLYNSAEETYKEEYSLYFKDYEDYKKNYVTEYYKETLKRFPNEFISSNSKVPTVIQFVANRKEKDGKFVIEFFEDSGFYNGEERGIVTVSNVLKTSSAKKMIESNRNRNEKNKTEIEEKISNLKIINNENEIQEEIEEEKQKVANDKKIFLKFNDTDIIIYGIIGVGTFLCVLILILKFIRKTKKKKEDKDGNKE